MIMLDRDGSLLRNERAKPPAGRAQTMMRTAMRLVRRGSDRIDDMLDSITRRLNDDVVNSAMLAPFGMPQLYHAGAVVLTER